MGIKYNETTGQWISSDYGYTGGSTLRNVRLVLNLDTPSSIDPISEIFIAGVYSPPAIELTFLGLHSNGFVRDNYKFFFAVLWSGSYGWWSTTNDVLSNGYNEIFVTYDGGSTANDPIFYVNGASVAVTEVIAPTGTLETETPINCTLGTGNVSTNGTLLAVNFITGRIVSAAEVLEAYNSRLAIYTYNGLSICPDLRGASGGVDDGDSLSAANKVRDYLNGVSYTPQNNPVLTADTYLNWK